MKKVFVIFDPIRKKYLKLYKTFEEAVEFLIANNRDSNNNKVVILKRKVKINN